MLLKSHSCPVCGADSGLSEPDLQAFDFSQGLAYLSPLIRKEGNHFQASLTGMSPLRCSVCNARYLDPWLSPQGRSQIFITGHPIHNVGWRSFLERAERNLVPDLQIDAERLLEILNSETGGLLNYFELGCPFQGLLLHFSKRQHLESYRTGLRTFTGMSRDDSRRFIPPIRVFMRLAGIARTVAFVTSRLRTIRDKVRHRYLIEPKLSLREFPNLQKYFVPLESTKFWGANCSMFGESCTATAMGALNTTLMTHHQLKELGKIPRSCIGLFNVLDHQDNPLQLLRECLNRATAVVVLGHEPPLGIQHHIGLGSDFFASLPALIDGVTVKTLSDPDSKNILCILKLKN